MIVSLYSNKENIGCTMAAVNMGILLSNHFSKKTLIVNWNFAASKLANNLSSICKSPSKSLIDVLSYYKNLIDSDKPILLEHLVQCRNYANLTSINNLYYLPASIKNDTVFDKSVSFDWIEFYEVYQGGFLIDHLKSQWEKDYEVVLIVSERGASDAAAICTIQLPDVIIMMVDMNMNGIWASLQLIQRFISSRKEMGVRELKFLPVLSKIDDTNRNIQEQILMTMKEQFSKYLPMEIDSNKYFNEVGLQYVPYYSYDHKAIPVLYDPQTRRASLFRDYMTITQYLVDIIESDLQ